MGRARAMTGSDSDEIVGHHARDRLRDLLTIAASSLSAAALAVAGVRAFGDAMGSTAEPFVTIGLVVVAGGGLVRVGPVRVAVERLIRAAGSPAIASASVLAITAVAAATINLDVAVVLAMPLALEAAWTWRLSAARMTVSVANVANAASILLPTSNLTNVLVFRGDPLPGLRYAQSAWLAWVLVCVASVAALAMWICRSSAAERSTSLGAQGGAAWSWARVLGDLVAMFLIASAIRTLLPNGLVLPGSFAEQAGLGSVLASGLNNLPLAAALAPASQAARWAGVLAAAIGPNLLVTGSIATILCRRAAREAGSELPALTFSLVGFALVPIQLVLAFAGLRIVGAI